MLGFVPMKRVSPLCLALAIGLACFVAGAPAEASKAAAQALFDKGMQQTEAGEHEAACKSFAESQKLDPGVGTAYQLGMCSEELGRYASAWSAFHEAEGLASAAGQKGRAEAAKKRADALDDKLSKIVVQVGKDRPKGLMVRIGETDIGEGAWGTPIPFDPGEHEVSATAPQHKPWNGSVTVPIEPTSVTLAIPSLLPKPATDPVPGGKAGTSPFFWTGLGATILGVSAGAVGGALVGIGVADEADQRELWRQTTCGEENMAPHTCTEAEIDDMVLPNSGIVPGFVLIGSGVAFAGVGVALMVVFSGGDDDGKEAAAEAWRVTPLFGPTSAGVQIQF